MKPIIIAGPCMAEDPVMMEEVAAEMKEGLEGLGVDYYFKASFDKANRTTLTSQRGPGMSKGLDYLNTVKEKFGVKTLTDVHEPWQCQRVATSVDVLQIPAMLCRQTDLLMAAGMAAHGEGRKVNIKKGQFFSPQGMAHAAAKTQLAKEDVWLCERGTTFGYGDLVVDMRGLKIMESAGHPVIMDITHCTQKPPAGDRAESGAAREFAATIARAAAATGYLSGVFMEVHPNPEKALSDGPAMITPPQAILLTKYLIDIMKRAQAWRTVDYYVK